eukprot:365721-Chlamydomonas_euryale.AAC.18
MFAHDTQASRALATALPTVQLQNAASSVVAVAVAGAANCEACVRQGPTSLDMCLCRNLDKPYVISRDNVKMFKLLAMPTQKPFKSMLDATAPLHYQRSDGFRQHRGFIVSLVDVSFDSSGEACWLCRTLTTMTMSQPRHNAVSQSHHNGCVAAPQQ